MEQPHRFTAMTDRGKVRIDVERVGPAEYVGILSAGFPNFGATKEGLGPDYSEPSDEIRIASVVSSK
jgi:hypothetical protein